MTVGRCRCLSSSQLSVSVLPGDRTGACFPASRVFPHSALRYSNLCEGNHTVPVWTPLSPRRSIAKVLENTPGEPPFFFSFFKNFFSSLLISTGIQNCSRVAVLVPEMSCMRNMVSARLFFLILPWSASTAAHAELQLEIVSVHGALWSMMIQQINQ